MKIFFFFILSLTFVLSCSNDVNFPENDSDEMTDEDLNEQKENIYDLKVEENSENVLSCILTFKTLKSSSVKVRYFSETHSGYELSGKEGADHYFFLWGMRAETDYTIEIYIDGNEEPELAASFTSGSLPQSVPPLQFRGSDQEKVSEGFVMFTYYYIPEDKSFPIAVMIDEKGYIVWYFEYYMSGFNVIGDVQYIDATDTILMSLSKGPNMADIPAEEAIEIDLEGNVVWRSKEILSVCNGPNSWHHVYNRVDDNSLVFLKPDILNSNVVGDMIVNFDREYNELWSWKFSDHFEVPDCPASEICDWTHSNHVNLFAEDRAAYVNSRNFSSYLKIDMNTQEIVWTFGKGGDFTMLTDHPDPWFEFAHAPKMSGEKRDEILFYDNGSVERGYSRVIKYRINENDMTAEVIFEFDGSKIGRPWYTPFWGDSDNLENGNILVTAGDFTDEEESRVFEITPDGEVVWELLLVQPRQEDLQVALYNSCKFIPKLKKL